MIYLSPYIPKDNGYGVKTEYRRISTDGTIIGVVKYSDTMNLWRNNKHTSSSNVNYFLSKNAAMENLDDDLIQSGCVFLSQEQWEKLANLG